MNSLTKLIADLRKRSADMDNGMFSSVVSEKWFDGRREGYRLAADLVEDQFTALLEKIRAAESKIIESEIES